MEETTPHLLSQCNYSEAVWNLVAANSNLPAFNIMIGKGGPKQWMQHVISSGSKSAIHLLVDDLEREKQENFLAQRELSSAVGIYNTGHPATLSVGLGLNSLC
jgi:hypothetical protein